MTRFDTKPLKLGCGLLAGLLAALNIVLLALLTLAFGFEGANYHGNGLVMLFFSVLGIIVSRLLIKSATGRKDR